jgi:hypothetical protein
MNWAQFGLGFFGLVATIGGASVILMSKVRKVADDANARLVQIYKEELAVERQQRTDYEAETQEKVAALTAEIVKLEHQLAALQAADNRETAAEVVAAISELWSPEMFAQAIAAELDRST